MHTVIIVGALGLSLVNCHTYCLNTCLMFSLCIIRLLFKRVKSEDASWGVTSARRKKIPQLLTREWKLSDLAGKTSLFCCDCKWDSDRINANKGEMENTLWNSIITIRHQNIHREQSSFSTELRRTTQYLSTYISHHLQLMHPSSFNTFIGAGFSPLLSFTSFFDSPLTDGFSYSTKVLAEVASCCATQTDDRPSAGRCPPSAGNNQQMTVADFLMCLCPSVVSHPAATPNNSPTILWSILCATRAVRTHEAFKSSP